MGLEEIISEIEEGSRKRVQEILDLAKKEADELKKDAKKKAEQILNAAEAKGREESKKEKTRKIAQARVEARKLKLGNKQQIIDQAFRNFYEYLNGEGFDAAILHLMKDLPGEGVLSFSERDVDRIKEVIKGKYEFTPSDKVKDGFVLKSGNIEYDCTFATLIENIRERLEGRVVDILFGGCDSDG